MTPVASTSCWVAASRAREASQPEPLFHDPYAAALAGEIGHALLEESQKTSPGANPSGPNPYLSIRTRFFDEALVHAVEDPDRRQVVVLAAGMDTRSFRLRWPIGTTFFEVDRDEVFAHKEPILQGLNAKPACTRRVVRADLEHDWIGPLGSAGFDDGRPVAFLVEGLLVYLTDDSVESLLTALRRAACPASWLGVDLAGTELLSSPYMKALLEMAERHGFPWRYGTSDPEGLLARHGWAPTVTMPGEPAANYGRWPYPPAPRNMPGIPRSYLVTAAWTGD